MYRCGFTGIGAVLAITLALGAVAASGATTGLPDSAALRAQAHRLYAPVRRYDRSVTIAERIRAQNIGQRLSTHLDACDKDYLSPLTHARTKPRAKLYMLWDHAGLLQTYQADVEAYTTHLKRLAAAWAALSLHNRTMNRFVHAVATELNATFDQAPFNNCSFIRQMARHHYSYAWASRSADGLRAARWWKQISTAGNRTSAFWFAVYPNGIGAPPSPLFTQRQLSKLANLPGELG